MRMNFWTIVAAIAAAMWSSSALGAHETAPRPDWVHNGELPEANLIEQAEDGVHYLLVQRDHRTTSVGVDQYLRIATQVVSRSGLESVSRFDRSYDPTEDTLIIHAINIIRDGQMFERLPQMELETIRQEQELDDGVIDGTLNVIGEIPDVRVGDIVDIEVTWESRETAWPGNYFRTYGVNYSMPVERIDHRLTVPSTLSVQHKGLGTTSTPTITPLPSDFTRYHWRHDDVEGIVYEDNTPSTYFDQSLISVSTVDTWEAVANWAVPLYQQDPAFSAEFTDRLEAMKTASRPDQITWAVRYVQDEIRYVSDSKGLGAFVPRPPITVQKNGYGDCKDKSLLLVSILKAFGIDAFPALVHSEYGLSLPSRLPASNIFDHAVVGIPDPDGTVWIDATFQLQGGVFPNIPPASYGYALPIREGATLERMPSIAPDAPTYHVEQTWDMTDAATTGVSMTNVIHRTGYSSDTQRRTLDRNAPESISDDWFEFYSGIYPGLERPESLSVTDDRDANELVTTEYYFLPAEKYNDLAEEFPFWAEAIDTDYPGLTSEDRKAPLAIPGPLYLLHTLKVTNLPFESYGIEEMTFDESGVFLSIENVEETTTVQIDYTLKTSVTEIPAAEALAVTQAFSDFMDWEEFTWDVSSGSLDWLWANEVLFVLLSVIVLFGAGIPLLIWACKSDDSFEGSRALVPIGMPKWIVYNLLSYGIYTLFWMFRSWRQHKRDGADISPFWRAFWSIFFFHSLFFVIREKDGDRVPAAIGVFLTIGYVITVLIERFSDRIDNIPLAVYHAAAAGPVIMATPLVLMLRRANTESPLALSHHDKWSARSFMGLSIGAIFTAAVIWGASA